ncbi:MAG: DeoR/GlpR transcriptional regulator [Clostridia bacterium]|nr:DeoR/GlpR transcriptional regulator [Clostridia bacterium]
MPFYEREHKILDILSAQEETSLTDLSQKLFISLPTLRRDLIKLEKKGLIIRGHGKVSQMKTPADTKVPYALRETEQNPAKNYMAKIAAEHIKDGDIVMLDASTSACCVVPHLAELKNIIAITSGAKTALLLAQYGITNICTGGRMINKSFSYIGSDAVATLSRYNADVAIFSCRGLSYDGIPSDSSAEENDIRRAMMRRSKKQILLCDGRKIGKVYLNNLCEPEELDEIISDAKLPKGAVKK